jgi:hypothetical protein
MPIIANETHEVPEQVIPAKSFPNLWILDLNIQARDGTLAGAEVYLNVCPQNAETGEYDPAAAREYRFPLLAHLMAEGGANPLAAAMAAVELAVPWVETQEVSRLAALAAPPEE